MKISTVNYTDFGPFESATVDFSQTGLTVVEGEIKGVKGCDSNGAGKSFLLDGVAWALYGRCVRDRYKGSDVIRHGAKSAEVTVTIAGHQEITVTRFRRAKDGGVRLFIDGKDVSLGTNPETDAAIVEALGMDFATFASSVAFSGVLSFFEATDKERKAILERFLGLGAYAAAEGRARDRLKLLQADRYELTQQIAKLDAQVTTHAGNLEEIQASASVADVELEASVARAAEQLAKRRLDEHARAVSRAKSWVAAEEVAAKAVRHDYMGLVHEHESIVAAQEREIRAIERAIGTLEGTQSRIKQAITHFVKLAGVECPTCKQTVDPEAAEAAADGLRAELESVEASIQAKKQERDGAVIARNLLKPPEEPDYPSLELERGHLAAERLEHQIRAGKFAECRTARQAAERALDQLTTTVSSITAKMEKAEKDLRVARKTVANLTTQMQQVTFWVEGFSAKGVRSFLLESTFPHINQTATAYARQLFGIDVTIRINATKQLKSKDAVREELTIEATIPGYTKTYAGASKGQKRRLDLALLLAFRDLIAARASRPFDQFFADELFDGLDGSGVDAVLSLLGELSQDRPVVLVTHDDRLKSSADRVLFVRHEGGKAVLT